MAVYKGRQARGPAGQSFINSLAMCYLGGNMKTTEIIAALNGLRFDLEQWKLSDETTDYYDDVLSEALTILVDLDR
jgi:hypothetical protein